MNDRTQKRIAACIAAALILCMVLLSAMSIPRAVALADSSLSDKFEETNVFDDLEGSTIDGKKFNASAYKITVGKDTTVLSLVEFCYAANLTMQGNWGLYVYVYNPKRHPFINNPQLNMVQLSFGDSDTYNKYPLQLLNASIKDGYEGLFYKFKVILTATMRKAALTDLDPNERVYRMGEIELQSAGTYNADSVPVGKIFYYTGYVQGFGSAVGNLQSRSEETDIITLRKDKGEVGFTWFRPDGSNGTNAYTQDSLHSVYFVVPNSFIESYGDMTEVHATWRDAVLAPILVTGNDDLYQSILNEVKTDQTDDWAYALLGDFYDHLNGAYFVDDTNFRYQYGFSYWHMQQPVGDVMKFSKAYFGKDFQPKALLRTNGKANSADEYQATPDEIQQAILIATAYSGGELINGKYSKALFESVSDEWADQSIKSDDTTKPLTREVISRSWWDKFWHKEGSKTSFPAFDNIEAIHTLTDSDWQGDRKEICKNLYISAQNYDDLKDCYDRYSSNSTIFLMRYQVSEYVAQEISLVERDALGVYKEKDSNSYVFQETLNLDFDLIDVKFSNGEKTVTIPVAMTPFDVIPGSDPPLSTHSDGGGLPAIIKIILIVLLIVVAIIVVYMATKGADQGASLMKPKNNKRE